MIEPEPASLALDAFAQGQRNRSPLADRAGDRKR
jgi:hypothetical protein